MKRTKLRKAFVISSFLLFPLTIYYLSPYLIIMGAGKGIITGSFIVFGAMLLFSLFFGRVFCGWACPAGGLQDCLMLASDRKAAGGRGNWIKYIIWTPWILLIAFVAINAGGYKKVDFFYQTVYGISVSRPEAYIIYYAVILLITVLALTAGKRSFCHYVCWMAPFMVIGGKVGRLLKLPSLRLEADTGKCTRCGLCSRNCPMSLEVDRMVEKGSMENPECVLCGDCKANCPGKAIRYAFFGKDRSRLNKRGFISRKHSL